MKCKSIGPLFSTNWGGYIRTVLVLALMLTFLHAITPTSQASTVHDLHIWTGHSSLTDGANYLDPGAAVRGTTQDANNGTLTGSLLLTDDIPPIPRAVNWGSGSQDLITWGSIHLVDVNWGGDPRE